MYKAIAKDGHVIANHTYSHDYSKVYMSPENFEKDIKKLDKYIEETIGQNQVILLDTLVVLIIQ